MHRRSSRGLALAHPDGSHTFRSRSISAKRARYYRRYDCSPASHIFRDRIRTLIVNGVPVPFVRADQKLPAQSGERRPAAILAADVVGYTRLMEADEAGTHGRLMGMRATVELPAIERQGGRLIKNTGDGFLAMFGDATSAMHAAMEIQRGAMSAEAEVPPHLRIAFRMGVNVAEVIVEDHDVYGDGVNVAARLQSHAEPYGVVISELVAEAVGGTLGMQAVDLGQIYLRNREHPVRILSLHFPDAPATTIGETLPGGEGRPTIAVLPFRRLLAVDDGYFADGIVDNIIHTLAALKDLFVIARGSTLGFGGGDIDVRAIGKALGVRYLLYGSAQKLGNRVRITTELLDTETAATVSADQYNGSYDDIFELQDRIAAHVTRVIAPRVQESELKRARRKNAQSMTAYDLVLQALESLHKLDYASFSRARGLLQRAMVIDPGYAPSYSYAARWHTIRVGQGWSADVAGDSKEASRLAERAIACDPLDPLALSIYGHVQSFLHKNYAAAIQSFDRAIAASPSCDLAWTLSSATYGYAGDGLEAVRRGEIGLRLSPLDSRAFFAEHILSQAHFINGNYAAAQLWAKKSDSGNDSLTSNLRILAASEAALDRMNEARLVAVRHRAIEPGFTLSTWSIRTPLQRAIVQRAVELLKSAGFPE